MRWRRGPSQRAFVKECERLLAGLPIPTPFSVEALVRNMEVLLGRQIRLAPLDDPDGGLGAACGLRVKAPEFTIILYRRRSSRNQTEHIILHELVHEWLDHGTCLTAAEIERYVPERIRQEVIRRFPSTLVQGRVDFDSHEEKQAELSASLIKRLARRQSFTGDDMVSLLENSLAHPVAPPRRRV
uniref:Toxin n=1 Tax=Streptomyces sp. NBC_00008 TaxID=2903610 RepID=A0AAU2VM05_9ACTN